MDGAIRKEVLVHARKVGAAAADELEGGVDLDGKGMVVLNGEERILLFLLDGVAHRAEVLDDVGRARETRGGRDVVQRRVVCESRRTRSSEELLVSGLVRHSEDRDGT